jgi:ubiquinone/menaquinone biosynthesis C-methylase UbiE
MKLYDRYILPRLVNLACGVEPCMQQRAQVVPAASGRVLEVGFGSGLNLGSYDPARVEHVWALEPSREMWDLARERVLAAPFPVAFVQAPAEAIPLDADSADTVVVTYALCTIPDVPRALKEIRRVLRPGGRLLFCEHGASPDENVRRWQNRLDPLWTRLAGGCHLNRRAPDLLAAAGFEVTDLSAGYSPGWKVDSFHFWGAAVPA